MMRAPAAAKINLALVVGPARGDGKHEVLTVYQRIDLVDRIEIEEASQLRVDGFKKDTLVRTALERLAAAAGVEPRWRVKIEKHIPLAAGLGGGSSDAATALRLANSSLAEPLPATELHALAVGIGADVPFFLADGPQLGSGDGSDLEPLGVSPAIWPQDFWVLVLLPHGVVKRSTADVYSAFDARNGAVGWEERRARLERALAMVTTAHDLAALPPNDLASAPLANEIRAAGAFRADVSGAGPALYGLFLERSEAVAASRSLQRFGETWVTAPCWYG
jgi:4-diphosphocytidyl-2-C-methyl-D-erythritol kinase